MLCISSRLFQVIVIACVSLSTCPITFIGGVEDFCQSHHSNILPFYGSSINIIPYKKQNHPISALSNRVLRVTTRIGMSAVAACSVDRRNLHVGVTATPAHANQPNVAESSTRIVLKFCAIFKSLWSKGRPSAASVVVQAYRYAKLINIAVPEVNCHLIRVTGTRVAPCLLACPIKWNASVSQ